LEYIQNGRDEGPFHPEEMIPFPGWYNLKRSPLGGENAAVSWVGAAAASLYFSRGRKAGEASFLGAASK
jgi:hypothetical protein